MEKFTYRLMILAGILLFSNPVFAQFKYTSSSVIGQVLTIDTLMGVGTLEVHFNTSLDSSYWYYNDSTQTAFTLSLAKCQTRKGLQVKMYDENGVDISKGNKDFECNNYGGYRNPVRVNGVASLMELIQKSKEQNAGTEDSLRNRPYYPAACLFDLDETGTDQAFGAYPGKFKHIEYGFQYSFEGVSVLDDDIVFEMDTYDEGNTGLTASYAFSLAIGHPDSVVAEIPDFYISGSAKKKVKVAEAGGVPVSEFANKNVYFFLKTMGTGTEISEDKMDPIIVFDNFSVSYQMPMWVEPAAGINNNAEFSNQANVAMGEIGKDSLYSIVLKTSGRLGRFIITNVREEEETKLFALLPEGGVKANDGSGNYTVDVPYEFTPGDYETRGKMVIAAPDSGTVDDDLMLFIKATPKTTDVRIGRIELDCGVRIWYDFYLQGTPATSVDQLNHENNEVKIYPNPADKRVFVAVTVPTQVAVYNMAGSMVKSKMLDPEHDFIDVSDLTRGVYFIRSMEKNTFVKKLVVE